MYELRAKSQTEAEMLMYGTISEWGRVRAEDLFNKITDVKAKGYQRLKLKINSPGGSQFEGIAIMSQMGTKEIFIHGVVEGIAASMGAIILQGCHRRSMVKGTRLMVHQGSGGVYGSANYIRDYADLVESMNKTLAEILAKRSKRDAEYILKNWMTDGKDTWFSAEDALKEGLIDDIIDGNVVPLKKEQASLVELAAHYEQFLDKTEQPKMDRDKLIKELNLKADATDAEILAAITSLKAQKKEEKKEEKKDEKTDDAKAGSPTNDAAVDVVLIVAKERGVSDEMIEKIKKVAAVDVKLAMDLLPEKNKEEEKAVSINDLVKALNSGGKENPDRKNWSFKDWQKNDPNGLLAMAQSKPGDYASLFEKAYGYRPSDDEIKKLAK